MSNTIRDVACSQGKNAVPSSASEVAGSKVSDKEARKTQWLEAQQSGMQRPQDEFKWDIENSHAPFKGLLSHWREFIEVRLHL